VKNVQESGGRLQATGAFFDGRPSTYRIVDPRQFILSASFDLSPSLAFRLTVRRAMELNIAVTHGATAIFCRCGRTTSASPAR